MIRFLQRLNQITQVVFNDPNLTDMILHGFLPVGRKTVDGVDLYVYRPVNLLLKS